MAMRALDVILIAALVLVLFAVFSTIIFAGRSDRVDADVNSSSISSHPCFLHSVTDSGEGSRYFSSYWVSCYEYFVLFLLGDFPNAM